MCHTDAMFMRWVGARVHVSWLVAVCCVGIVLGVAMAGGVFVDMSNVSWLLSGTALVLFGATRGKAWVVPIVLLGGALIGLWRGSVVSESSTNLLRYVGSSIRMSGTVMEDSDVDARGRTTLRLRDLTIDSQAVTGTAWLSVEKTNEIRRSDIVTAEGTLSEGFGSFGASMYGGDITKVERPVPGDVALAVRDWFSGGVERSVGSPESDLGLGYLVGQRRGLPPDLDQALQVAGLTHIVVASGYNLTILVRFARRAFEKISKYLSFMSASLMIICFVAVTGLSPSMSRAGLVAGLSLIAWYYGRNFHPLVLLPLAMAVTVLLQPSFAWGDVGWQLSFAAFGGVMIMAPLLQAYFFGDKPERPLRRIFIETISAQIWTLPVLLSTFGQLSLIAPIANMLILPLVPLAMALTFFAGLGGLLLPVAATTIGFPAELVLSYMTTTIMLVGSISWASTEVKVSMLIAGCMYLLIVVSCVWMWRATRLQLDRTSLVE
jgi:competence protein ComEC